MRKLVLIGCLFFMTGWVSLAQTVDTLSVDFQDITLESALDSITFKTGYFFSYNTAIIPEGSLFVLEKSNVHVRDLLNELLVGTGLEYTFIDDQVVLRKSSNVNLTSKKEARRKTAIKGWVRMKDTDEVLPGANVFIDGTTIGTVTGPNGEYLLEKIPEGSNQLVFSHIGYTTFAYAINVQQGAVYVVNAYMVPQTTELDSIEVSSQSYVDPKHWLRYYKEFEKEFIGNSTNSFSTTIINKEALNFTYDQSKDILRGYADEPLEIVNDALGYKINCQMEHFEKNKEMTSFHVKVRFQNMEHTGRKEKRRWRRNRKLAYDGSSAHFFKSLIKGSYEREGFKIYRHTLNNEPVKVDRSEIIRHTENGLHWKLCFQGPIYVQYTEELESREYLSYSFGGSKTGDLSLLNAQAITAGYQRSELLLKENEVLLYSNGQIQKPENVIKTGYWSWERVADLMPNDYGLKNK